MSELARLCPCGESPSHTIGWCDALSKAKERKLIYSSKLDVKRVAENKYLKASLVLRKDARDCR